MNNVGFFVLIDEVIEELETVKQLVDFALKKENVDNVEFNVIIVDNKEIRKINKDYRQIDKETDVISFALEDNDDDINIYDKRILGDIYISYEKAKEQAKEYNHSLLRELSFLTIHGLLHLLGYDHMNQDEEKIMFERQELILNEFGIKR